MADLYEPRVGLEDAGLPEGAAGKINALRASMESVIHGKPEVVENTLIGLFAEGHVLIEDVPGVGKTILAQSLARSLDASFGRIQFTSDMLPSDILGVSVFQPATSEFEFKPGPIFAQILLADEINRATPKTQSAMLEAMNEAQVSVDANTFPVPRPFMVLATQNPIEHQGTYPLPESQLDRFLMRIRVGYPSLEAEKRMLEAQQRAHPIDALEPVMTGDDVLRIQSAVRSIRIDDTIGDYLVRLVSETRQTDRLSLGASPRGTLLLQRASQSRALVCGRDFVVPDDVQAVAVPVLAHRVLARAGDNSETVIEDILRGVPVPL